MKPPSERAKKLAEEITLWQTACLWPAGVPLTLVQAALDAEREEAISERATADWKAARKAAREETLEEAVQHILAPERRQEYIAFGPRVLSMIALDLRALKARP